MAIIAAIALTLRTRKDNKQMDPSQQVRVKARDRVSLVKQAATMAAPPPVPTPAPGEEKKP